MYGIIGTGGTKTVQMQYPELAWYCSNGTLWYVYRSDGHRQQSNVTDWERYGQRPHFGEGSLGMDNSLGTVNGIPNNVGAFSPAYITHQYIATSTNPHGTTRV